MAEKSETSSEEVLIQNGGTPPDKPDGEMPDQMEKRAKTLNETAIAATAYKGESTDINQGENTTKDSDLKNNIVLPIVAVMVIFIIVLAAKKIARKQ